MKNRVIANGEDWSRIISDPSMNTLAKKINRRFPYMGEQDIEWLVLLIEKNQRTQNKKEEK